MRTGPDYIQLYPTLRCNKACDFCFNRSMPDVPDLSPDAFRTMLEVFNSVCVKTIDIIGGEPTLHPDMPMFVREAVAKGFTINLSSNGSNLKALEEIMRMGEHVTVGVSVNDRESLDDVREFILANRPVVKTVYRPGMDRGVIEEILSLGPKKFYLIYRDELAVRKLYMTVPFYQFKSGVERHFDHRQVGMVYCSGFLPDRGHYPELSQTRCPAGTTKLGVMPDGSVYPCNLFFGKGEFFLGNILADSFTSIWNHGRLKFFRTASGNVCPRKSCVLHSKCHGGCPAHSLFIMGDLSAPDPRCKHS